LSKGFIRNVPKNAGAKFLIIDIAEIFQTYIVATLKTRYLLKVLIVTLQKFKLNLALVFAAAEQNQVICLESTPKENSKLKNIV
jgi:hypothetical protein